MELTDYVLNGLSRFIIGGAGDDKPQAPYLTARKIVELFNKFGIRDIYHDKLPDDCGSRIQYCFKCLKQINGTEELPKLILYIFSDDYFKTFPGYLDNFPTALSEVNSILIEDGIELVILDGKTELTGVDIPEAVNIEPIFEDIQSEILKNLQNAKYTIWVAVAWLTDPKLMRVLYESHSRGVNVRLILQDDKINRNTGFDKHMHFETNWKLQQNYFDGIMHNKFCIIDFKTVIHGSYNWTKKANFNKEGITIIHNRKISEEFSDEFIKLFLSK